LTIGAAGRQRQGLVAACRVWVVKPGPGAATAAGCPDLLDAYDQLLQYLTPGSFEAAIKMNESVTPIKRQIRERRRQGIAGETGGAR
jgi:hypothetical protein